MFTQLKLQLGPSLLSRELIIIRAKLSVEVHRIFLLAVFIFLIYLAAKTLLALRFT